MFKNGAALVNARIEPLTNGAFSIDLMTVDDQDHAKRTAEGKAAPNLLSLLVSPEMLDHLAQLVAQAQEAALHLNSHGGQNN